MIAITNIVEVLARLGVKTVDSEYRAVIDTWMSWYKGKVEDFHTYNVWNGIKQISVERASLGMAKTICEDWANLLLNERVGISVSDERVQEIVDDVLVRNCFTIEANRTIERAFASGTGAFSEWMDENNNLHIDFHDGRAIFPLAWRGNQITECAFTSVDVRDGKKCLYLRMYRRINGQQVIENHWLDYDSGNELSAPEGVERQVKTGIEAPLFQIVTPNLSNNIDTTCPMGISVFANAIDSLKAVDIAFDSFKNEFQLGRKRLLVPASMIKLQTTRDGDRAPLFDPNDLVYVAYEAGEDTGEFHDLSPEIRAQEHITGLRTNLNLLSTKCGLGVGRYEFEKSGGIKTATEVVSEHSDLYQSIQKHEQILRGTLEGLVRVICECSHVDPGEITISFDDSIIQDKGSIRADAREDVTAGLMSKYRYLTQIRGMGEDDAQEELARIAAEQRVTGGVIDFFQDEGADNP